MKFSFKAAEITVNTPNRAELLAQVSARLGGGQGFALATINLDHLVKLAQLPDFARAYAAQDLVVADGNPIVWLSRLARAPVDLVPGSELVIPLCQIARDLNLPVVFIGSTAEALDGAEAALQSRIPGLIVAQKVAPKMGFDPSSEIARAILSALAPLGPGICFLALGAPKQEKLAALGRALAPQMGFASIGAGLDFLSGHQTRAPAWVRAVAMEWLWRALSSPRRLIPRYAACLAILPAQVLAALRQR